MTVTTEDFPGGGETGALIRTMDWSRTPLGSRAQWPQSLKTLVRVMLNTRQPMILWWGDELTQLYNDAMLESMRDKHPRGMGEPGREAWREAWRVVGHELQRVVDHGDMIWNEDMFVPVDRNGTIEDAYWTYSYSPVFDDAGLRAGMLIICTETTAGVVARKQLEAAREELRGAFEGEQTLRRLAEAGASARDEFLAMLGHELRNPLAPIVTAMELMRLGGDHYPRERAIIERQVTHLSQLVDDLLDVARVARGKLELRSVPVDLTPILNRAIEMASPLLEGGQHELRWVPPAEPLVVAGDEIRLAQVFANLLMNAAKYTPPHGHIEVTAVSRGDAIEVRVADTGPGLSPTLLPRIFELFVQGERRSDRAEGGLGLGLALVKTFVTAHGGTVTADNRPTGGSVFTVQLPALANGAAALAAQRTQARPAPAISSTARKVLVVDDNEDAAQLLYELLTTLGHTVELANDGPQALAILEQFTPDIAFLDLGLPGMDGFELARAIRQRFPGPSPRLVAVTGYGQARDRDESAAAGFHAHVTKPVAFDQLTRLVAES